MDVGARPILLTCKGFHIAYSPEDQFFVLNATSPLLFNRNPNTTQGIPELLQQCLRLLYDFCPAALP